MTFFFSLMMTVLFAQKPNGSFPPPAVSQEQSLPMPPNAPAPPPPPPLCPDLQSPQALPQLNLPDLTPDQQEKIHVAGLDHLKMLTPLQNQLREKRARLQTMLTTSPFDAKLTDQAAEEFGKIQTDILKATIRHDQALRNILTPQQQVIFDSRPKPFLHREK